MSYRLPNVGRLREAQRLAATLALLPGHVLNREATLIVRCPQGAVLCRVFRMPEGLLFVPVGRTRRGRLVGDGQGNGRSVPVWDRPDPYWLDAGLAEQIRCRCRCHADVQIIETADMFDHIRRGERTMIVPVR